MAQENLTWQSKLVLLVVLPFAGTDAVLSCFGWADQSPSVLIWTAGLSALLGLVTWKLRAATPAAALTGALITASLMFSTVDFPYEPWHTALIPTLAVSALALIATRVGRAKKERLGTAEHRRGRSASQVAANLGAAMLASNGLTQRWFIDSEFAHTTLVARPVFAMGLAALAEAAADTVSSEIGQVFGRRPRMITTFRAAEPGRNGAVSLVGTLAGIVAAAIVAGAGTWALRGDWNLFAVSCGGAVFGLLFDSLLGGTLENLGWLNNDAVNFLSTASASGFVLAAIGYFR
ncbi:MAG: DUF92 domain-containing protein [Terracidiphilus sp.]